MQRFWKTSGSRLLIATFGLFACLSAILGPASVFAQGGPVVVIEDIPAREMQAAEKAKEAIKTTFAGQVFTYLINVMSFALDYLAYESAVFVASGGQAESPLFNNEPGTTFGERYAQAVAGNAIGELQDELERAGGVTGEVFENFDLCQPRLNISIAINISLKSAYRRPEPKCDFNEVFGKDGNWAGFLAGVTESLSDENVNKAVLNGVSNIFDPSVNEFGVGLTIQSSVLNKANKDAQIAVSDLIKNDGFKPVVDFISGNIKTPAAAVNQEYFRTLNNKEDKSFKFGELLASNDQAFLAVGLHAGSVFTNTLLSSLSKRLAEGLFNFESDDVDPFADVESIASSNGRSARDQFSSLLAFTPFEITNYSILADFSTCPSGIQRGLYNCVADNSFVAAVGRADAGVPMTVEQAIEEGLVDGGWPLIKSGDARNQDPYCYTYGFCYSNLVKLRKARIIPIGWELAAESSYNTSGGVTLKEVMDGFSNCNDAGEADSSHQWCKLIDPNWVLKYPETQCKAQVYGQLLTTSASGERSQECVDMPSCIAENEDGTCTGGYGYCVKEENTWRFRGESCPAEFASCLTFSGEDKTVSYLENTVDFANCSSQNAGCLWYDTEKSDPEGDSTFDWQPVDDVAAADADPYAYNSRIYFTSAVEECDSSEGGCRQLYERDSSLSLNAVNNPGFERDANTDNIPDAWLVKTPGARIDDSGSFSRSGTVALLPGAGVMNQPGVGFSQGRFYTLSVYARLRTAAAATARVELAFTTDDPTVDINLTGTSLVSGAGTGCSISDSGSPTSGDGRDDAIVLQGTPSGAEFQRFSCTFTSPLLSSGDVLVSALMFVSGDVAIDDIQIEQGELPTSYHEGYSTSALSTLTVKVPPGYLGCTGAATDPAECANYAKVCSENDVGCSAYSPSNGDPTVTGVASELDYCPSTCSGYDTFKQEPTLYEPEGVFPVYFIPSTGESCSQEEVGCDEFTNLSNESKEYYTYLRSCVTEDQAASNTHSDQAATFYTWEGSDLEGYQLQTWSLLESNMPAVAYSYIGGGVDSTPHLAPCSLWSTTDSSIDCQDQLDTDGDLHKDWDTATCDEHDDIFTNPDCREFYDTSGGIHYRLWSKTVTVNNACNTYRKTEISGLDAVEQEANCTGSGGYFDASSGTCRYFGYPDESDSCSEQANGCRAYTGGRSRNSRVVLEDFFELGDLNLWDTGSAANVTLSNESLAVGGHSIAATNNFATFTFDNGGTCAAGGCVGTARSLGGTCTVEAGERYCGTLEHELFAGKTYTLSFWAKGTGNLTVGFDLTANPVNPQPEVLFGTIALTGGWQEYSLGPLDMTAGTYPTFGTDTTLAFGVSGLAYVDNIVLREGEDDITLIKNSWNTPIECDQTPIGTTAPQYYLGCQAYSSTNNGTVYLKSFSRLCSSDQVGCEDFFMTRESDSPFAEVYNVTCQAPSGLPATSPTACYYGITAGGAMDPTSQYLCTIGAGQTSCTFKLDWNVGVNNLPPHIRYTPSTVVVPADGDVFLVVNDSVTCPASAAGCQEVGNVLWNQDKNSTKGANSVYLLNDPGAYDDILCENNELFCAAWDTDDQGTFFFKDPGDQTCEFRTDVFIGGTAYDGWFRKDTDQFCYGTCSDGVTSCSSDADCGAGTCNTKDPSYLINGDFSGVWRNGDPNYSDWVGTCDSQFNTCSEFQDPLDYPVEEVYTPVGGKGYFFLNNSTLSEKSLPASQRCNGQVSFKEGCVLFNDTTQSGQTYNSSATETASVHADTFFGDVPYSLVDPIDCENGGSTVTLPDGSSVDLCAQRCVYDHGQVFDISDGQNRRVKLFLAASPGTPEINVNIDETYIFGSSCYQVDDCASVKSESGETVKAFACADNVQVNQTEPVTQAPVDRLTNDTNTVLKVDRDRQCSEWLSCAEDQVIWDERTASWKTVCSDIELCNQYSALGGTALCSNWKLNEPEVLLTDAEYRSRDVSWYGQEYSGYAIPDLYPVQSLEQANVAPPPGLCDLSKVKTTNPANYDAFHGDVCATDADCWSGILPRPATVKCVQEDDNDYRLALVAGSCTGIKYGETCSVGYCSETGAACTNSAACGVGGGTCVVGQCQVLGSLCSDDSSCAVGELCLAGNCVADGDSTDVAVSPLVSIENYEDTATVDCSTGSLALHTTYKEGSCIREQCILTPDGNKFDVAESEGKLCRAYPEVDSPFSSDMVDVWFDADTQAPDRDGADDVTWDDTPYDVVGGFERSNFCAPGEDCLCSYLKVSYGKGGDIRYFDQSTNIDTLPGGRGLCSDTGQACSGDADCGGDTCLLPSREDTLLGLEGYCLEKDTGININGDQNQNACLTWLPVDQLAGSTDLYAKFASAGFSAEAYYCGEVNTYTNLRAGGIIGDGNAGCSAIRGPDGTGTPAIESIDVNSEYCRWTLGCPEGFFAIVGRAKYGADADKGGAGHVAETQCDNSEVPFDTHTCPYMCIPYGSLHEDGSACTTPSMEPEATAADETDTSIYGTEFYYTANYDVFDDWYLNIYPDCTAYGASLNEDEYSVLTFDQSTDDYEVAQEWSYYPACKNLVNVASKDLTAYNYAWTNRVLGPSSTHSIDVGDLSYEKDTALQPFGKSLTPSEVAQNNAAGVQDPTPAVVPSCIQDPDNGTYHPANSATTVDCEDGYQPNYAYTEPPEGRSFVDFDSGYWKGMNVTTVESIANIVERLETIFAKPLELWPWSVGVINTDVDKPVTPGPGAYSSDDATELIAGDSLFWDVRSEGSPPTVWGVTTDCEGTVCEEGVKNSLSVNDQQSGDHSSFGFFRAYLNFYAGADTNQLPIRRIIVDWGDKLDNSDMQGSSDTENFYKNHRGLVPGKKTSWCDTDNEWGMTAASCDPNYFSYSHVYTCSPEIVQDTSRLCQYDGDKLLNSPCWESPTNSNTDSPVCVFQPRIHVRDNWGWCTGDCSADGVDGCFEGADSNTLIDPSARFSECAYLSDINTPGTGSDPWVYYSGVIKVN